MVRFHRRSVRRIRDYKWNCATAETGAGFEIESIERYRFGIPPLDPPKPHIIGRARRMEHPA